VCISFVLLSTACPTSLASEPNIRGGRSGVQTAPACGAAFGGIDNDQPEIKARQRHRARLDPKPRYPSKDFHHKEIAKKLRDGFRGLREKRKEPIHNFKGNTEGNSYVPVDLYFKCSGRAALNFFFFVCPLRGAGLQSSTPSLLLLLISHHLLVSEGRKSSSRLHQTIRKLES